MWSSTENPGELILVRRILQVCDDAGLDASIAQQLKGSTRPGTAWIVVNSHVAFAGNGLNAHIGLEVFLLCGLASLGIALLTVSYQAIRVARSNPINALQYD